MTYELHLGDALEFMAALPDSSVDAVITDPPYGTTELEWDKPVDWPTFWREAHRVCKPSAVQVVFSAQPFTTDLIVSNRRQFRYELIWDKVMATGFLNASKVPMRCHENIVVFGQGAGTYNPQKVRKDYRVSSSEQEYEAHGAGHYGQVGANKGARSEWAFPKTILTVHSGGPWTRRGMEHPTQKPVELMEWLVRTYSNPAETVLDPFAGSGSTGVAALREGRRFIGCELDPTYHAIATKRLEAAAAQPRLLPAS